jgi:tRNA (guanine37-N1)-methyltransferase
MGQTIRNFDVNSMKKIAFVTLFPDWIRQSLSQSIMARAEASGAVEFSIVNPRSYCYDSHKKVDDIPYGGHPGMLMKAEPVALAIESELKNHLFDPTDEKVAVVITEPSGSKFDQQKARALSKYDQIIFVCGHYEGIDHRIEETFATHVFSIGDYVLTNGELPALVMADAVVRLLPGVLGNQDSLDEESFNDDLLGAPNYTRPEIWRDKPIPNVLKSGNHAQIEKWRKSQALERTKERRPDLLNRKED